MKVYRYEKNGLGPYAGDFSLMFYGHTSSTGRPGIDHNHGFKYGYLCACPCPESLITWFIGYNESLLEEGFKIVEYECTDIIVCNYSNGWQCAFDPESIISKEFIT